MKMRTTLYFCIKCGTKKPEQQAEQAPVPSVENQASGQQSVEHSQQLSNNLLNNLQHQNNSQ